MFRLTIVLAALAVLCGCENTSVAPQAPNVHATFTAIDSVAGWFSHWCAWSPTEPWLAFSKSDGVYVYDASHPEVSPTRVSTGYGDPLAWSPDGRWLLILTERDFRRGTWSLMVTPATHESPTWIVRNLDVFPATWGSNGAIYYWERGFVTRHRVDPPAAWSSANPRPFPERPRLFVHDINGDVLFFYPESEREEIVHMNTRGTWVLLYAEFTDGRRFLVHIPDYYGGYTAVIDHWGIVRSRIVDFSGTSVNGDGSLVAGHVTDEDGHSIYHAWLHVGDSRGTWSTRITNVGDQALSPELSSVGSFIAYSSLAAGGIHVGTLAMVYDEQMFEASQPTSE